MELDRPGRRNTFSEVAGLYDTVRPDYPAILFDHLVALSHLPTGGRILEIGCGPGRATLPLAQRGYEIICVELGKAMADLAAHNLSAYPRVSIVNAPFEEWPLPAAPFDLVLSAEAFHWIDPGVGYHKAAAALRPGGALALIWNQIPSLDTPFWQAMLALYDEHAPHIAAELRLGKEFLRHETVEAIAAGNRFGPISLHIYPWTAYYPLPHFRDLLTTYSSIRRLPSATRAAVLAGVDNIVGQDATIPHPYETILYLAPRL